MRLAPDALAHMVLAENLTSHQVIIIWLVCLEKGGYYFVSGTR